jgi:hypothetical protein
MFRQLPKRKAAPTGGLSLIKTPFSGPLEPEKPRQGITVTKPSEIEEHLLRRNRQHFRQAKDTPFANAPLKQVFNWQGTGSAAEQVLDKAYNPMDDSNDHTLFDLTSTSTKILQSCHSSLASITPGLPAFEMQLE